MGLFRKHFLNKAESGNAMIYVLIVVALFAALSFILARNSDTSESGELSTQQLEMSATKIIQTAAQMKQGLDQMTFGGTNVDDLNFITPDQEPDFSTAPHIDKVFHPEGGNLVRPRLPDSDIEQITNDPVANWYLDRFNNADWTFSSSTDVMLTAFQIRKDICAKINEKLTGSDAIPVVAVPLRGVLVYSSHHTGGNLDFAASDCPGCDGQLSLCVEDPGNNMWAFYSILVPR